MGKVMSWRWLMAGGLCFLVLTGCDKLKGAGESASKASPEEVIQQAAGPAGLEGRQSGGANPHGQSGAAPAAGKAGEADFGAALSKEKSAPAISSPMSDVSPGSSKSVVPFADLKVAKASGANAYTVAELFANGASLNGKKVKIRGQVVKFSPQIMGKNWLHLQDGTGEPMKNTHDLVVTSAGKAEKGDTVVVEGVLSANKDFGAGYSYVVIVEDAAIGR